VEQAKSLRDAVVKARSADAVFVAFDHIGHSLMSAGKIKEGLAEYRLLASQHPKDALRKAQLAQALLDAGLAEQARTTIQEAIILDPKSALAFSVQGMILKNDLVGRPLKKGMNYAGAVAAYTKAVALDPKDKENIANLAILLEYDADGVRYSEHARLKEAVAQFAALKKLDEEYSRTYDDNVFYDLWYARDYKGMLDYAAGLPSSEVRKGLILAAIAASQGSEAALKKSVEITTDDQTRGKLLVTAGMLLARVRKYTETADLLAAGGRGQGNESQMSRSAALFRNTKPYEELPVDPKDPRSVVQQLYGEMLSGHLTLEKFKSFVNAGAPNSMEAQDKEFATMMSKLKFQMRATGLPLTTIADLAVSNMHYTVDGDDSLGYKITVESPGAAPQVVYVVRQEPLYKMVAF
jgi:Flp pilus assembly protein TadD